MAPNASLVRTLAILSVQKIPVISFVLKSSRVNWNIGCNAAAPTVRKTNESSTSASISKTGSESRIPTFRSPSSVVSRFAPAPSVIEKLISLKVTPCVPSPTTSSMFADTHSCIAGASINIAGASIVEGVLLLLVSNRLSIAWCSTSTP